MIKVFLKILKWLFPPVDKVYMLNDSVGCGVYTGRTDVTIEDIRNWEKELREKSVHDKYTGDLEVTEYDKDHYRLSGSVWGIVRKDQWNKLLQEAAEDYLKK